MVDGGQNALFGDVQIVGVDGAHEQKDEFHGDQTDAIVDAQNALADDVPKILIDDAVGDVVDVAGCVQDVDP